MQTQISTLSSLVCEEHQQGFAQSLAAVIYLRLSSQPAVQSKPFAPAPIYHSNPSPASRGVPTGALTSCKVNKQHERCFLYPFDAKKLTPWSWPVVSAWLLDIKTPSKYLGRMIRGGSCTQRWAKPSPCISTKLHAP